MRTLFHGVRLPVGGYGAAAALLIFGSLSALALL